MACDSPLWLQVKGQELPVPCGKCYNCKLRRVNEWVFRLMEEEKISSSAFFVTLTYDTAHVPLTSNGFMTLRKSDLQKYFKRLRKLCPDVFVKYYAVGEYGTENKRPHYHAIVFNVPDPEMFSKAWSLDGVQFGQVVVGTCTSDSVAYCLKYIDKQSWREKVYVHQRDDREREFPLMSKKLGASYLEPETVRYHKADLTRNYVTKVGGHKVAMPRYYRTQIFSEFELDLQRTVIADAVFQNDIRARHLHEASRSSISYADKLQYEREGRRDKLFRADKKRKL